MRVIGWKHGLLYMLLLIVLAAFPWGPLFAWSPVHAGYNRLQLSRADILYPNDVPLDPGYRDVDKYLATAETFHELKCSKRIKVVVCRNWSDCERFAAPFLAGQRPLAVTIATGFRGQSGSRIGQRDNSAGAISDQPV